ncbi:ADP-ribosylglycohydrolase family protein [Alienimonas californiensis]|uniref:ADP-ribosyl-[dinitrogen reductase] glycohydrolase n=1 Tax=Alienimonas californiensis TaxID=2527989 RepID=A0A517P8H9_9PLAN|nr:ADP-ribosylglycohydrolase family protein [Alienimonas californiensis]QDT15689.1 ADP-ribosyl-[dinitrogen reductase] glycohydrolase [Alienimonas californiensis]
MPGLNLADRIAGCLLGGALGNALAGPFENGPPGQAFEEPADLWLSDDTQLTLATCEALIEANGAVDPITIAAAFTRWHRGRRLRGVGASTLKALRELEVGGHWALVGAAGERSAGNGAAMRAAPLAFVLNPDDESDRGRLRDVSRITHHHEEAVAGALLIVRAVRYAAAGRPLAHLPAALADLPPDCLCRDRLRAVGDDRLSVRDYAERYGASGWAADSVPLALLAASRSPGFTETVAEIVGCGGDTDTAASMCGQILGAAHGPGGLPAAALERLEAATEIRGIAASLARVAANIPQCTPSP